MFSLRDFPLWFYKIFTLEDLQTIYPSNSYNLFRKVAFSIRAGCFLFSSRLYSLSNITKSLKKRLKNKQSPQPSYKQPPQPSYKQVHNLPTNKAHNLSTSKAHNLPTSKAHSLQQTKPTTIQQAKSTTILQAKNPQPHHIPNAQNHSENKQIQQNIPNILPFNIFLK